MAATHLHTGDDPSDLGCLGLQQCDCPYPSWLFAHSSFSHTLLFMKRDYGPSPCQAAGGTWCLAMLVHSEPPRLWDIPTCFQAAFPAFLSPFPATTCLRDNGNSKCPAIFGGEDVEDEMDGLMWYNILSLFTIYTLGLPLESRPDSLAKENQLEKEALNLDLSEVEAILFFIIFLETESFWMIYFFSVYEHWLAFCLHICQYVWGCQDPWKCCYRQL